MIVVKVLLILSISKPVRPFIKFIKCDYLVIVIVMLLDYTFLLLLNVFDQAKCLTP